MTVLYMVHAGVYTGLLPPDVHPLWLRLPLLHTRSWVGKSLKIHEKIQPESIQGKDIHRHRRETALVATVSANQ